jgi:hypothetical protein
VTLEDELYLTESLLLEEVQRRLRKPNAYTDYTLAVFHEHFPAASHRMLHLFFPALELLESHWYPRWCRALVDKHELLHELLLENDLAKFIVCVFVWTNRSSYQSPDVFSMGISINKDVEAETGILSKKSEGPKES